MTYKERLEQLESISVQKSNSYIDVMSEEGQSNSPKYNKAHAEWDVAEVEYISFLKLMESGQVNPAATIPMLNAEFFQRVKGIAASLFF